MQSNETDSSEVLSQRNSDRARLARQIGRLLAREWLLNREPVVEVRAPDGRDENKSCKSDQLSAPEKF